MAVSEHPGISPDLSKFSQAIAAMRKRVPVSNERWDELTDFERDRSMKVGVMAQGDLVQDVFDALDRAIEQGTTFEDFKADVGADLEEQWGGEDSPRLEGIYRTNVLGAYNDGRREIYNEPAVKEARPYWRWELIDDDRLCDICAEFEDVVLPADDPFWDEHKQPIHVSDRCTFTALSPDEADDAGVSEDAPEEPEGTFDGEEWEPDPGRFDSSIRDTIADRLR